MMDHETAGIELVPPKRKYLPNKILRAIDQAVELQGLTTGVRTTLQTICRYVSQHDPLGPVFTRKTKIADRAGLSERTVHRHIVKLESLGLLRAEDQRHGKKNGKFLVTHIFLTEKLARMVGLIGGEEAILASSPSDKMTGGHIKGLPDPSSTKKQGRPKQNGQRIEPTLPADLQPLAELGMWPQTICKLMKEAKDHGKRLSDILVAVKKRLSELQLGGKQIATYLRKAISSQTDFAAQAKKAQDAERQAEQGRADAALIAAFRRQYAGKRLRSRDGRETVVIHASGEHAQHRVGTMTGTLPLTTRTDVAYLLDKIEKGLLAEGAVLPSQVVASGPIRSTAVMEYLALMRKAVGLLPERAGQGAAG